MKTYLLDYYGISHKTFYNDIHGFIQLLRIYDPEHQKLYEAQTYKRRGDSIGDTDDYRKSIDSYDKVLNKKPDLWEAYYQRGEIYFKLEKYGNAIRDYNMAETHYLDDAEFFVNRGKAHYFNDDFHSAAEDYRQAIGLQSEYHPIMVHFHLSQALIGLEDWEELKKALTNLMNMDGDEKINDLFTKIEEHVKHVKIELPKDTRSLLDRILKKGSSPE